MFDFNFSGSSFELQHCSSNLITRAGIRVRVALEIEREHQVRMKGSGEKTGEKGAPKEGGNEGENMMENIMEKVLD